MSKLFVRASSPAVALVFVLLLVPGSSQLVAQTASQRLSPAAASVIIDYPANDSVCICPVAGQSVMCHTTQTGALFSYHIQASLDSNFNPNTLLTDDIVMGPNEAEAMVGPLSSSGVLYYRISTKMNTDWSETRRLKYIFPCLVTAVGPKNDSLVCDGDSLTLRWKNGPSIRTVLVQIYKGSVSGNPLQAELLYSGQSLKLKAPEVGNYVWRLKSVDSSNNSQTSEIRSFKVGTATVPVISSPKNNQVFVIGVDQTINLQWANSTGATRYLISVVGPGGSSLVDTLSANNLPIPVATLVVGTYSVKIAALCSVNSPVVWSEALSFQVKENSNAVSEARSSGINIVPIPTQNTLRAILDPAYGQARSYELSDALGQIFQRQAVANNDNAELLIDCSALPSGSYLLRIYTSVGQVQRLFVVAK